MDAVIRADNGVGLSEPTLGADLQAGNYGPVLKSLWCERDRTRRLDWLRSKANELHPPLMFEQAIAEFGADPTATTVNLVSIPMMQGAAFRVTQDFACAADRSVRVEGAADCLVKIYMERLEKQVQLKLRCSIKDISSDERDPACLAKIREIAQAAIDQTLPSPRWVGWHRMDGSLKGFPSMYPESEHKQRRDACARDAIQFFCFR